MNNVEFKIGEIYIYNWTTSGEDGIVVYKIIGLLPKEYATHHKRWAIEVLQDDRKDRSYKLDSFSEGSLMSYGSKVADRYKIKKDIKDILGD